MSVCRRYNGLYARSLGVRLRADLEVQARMHVIAARAPWNAWLWRPPQVVFYSTRTRWAPEVAARLRQQGVLVAGAHPPARGFLLAFCAAGQAA